MTPLEREIVRGLKDPLRFLKFQWPEIRFYDKEREMIRSVEENDITVCPAANQMGKDFTAAAVIVWFIMTRRPFRVVTTSAKDDHLIVLWGELKNFINTAKYPLSVEEGGPLLIKHREIQWVYQDGSVCDLSYVKGMVASQDSMASMGGHHIATMDGIPHTLFVVDEASSVRDEYLKVAQPWAHRILIIGNTWPCENFFKHAVKGRPGTDDKGGDRPRPLTAELIRAGCKPGANGYYRKVIRIKAEDSPNVKWARMEMADGKEPSNMILVPGVKSWYKYARDRSEMSPDDQCVSLDAEWYEGPDIKLFPVEWLQAAQKEDRRVKCAQNKAEAGGCDPGEGKANSSWAAANRWGVKEVIGMVTADTNVVPTETKNFLARHGLSGNQMLFDQGGGGLEHADRLRADGYGVDSIGFGEAPRLKPKRGLRMIEETIEKREEHYAYVNMRAQLYGELSEVLNPNGGVVSDEGVLVGGPNGFSLPHHPRLMEQMEKIPRSRDGEGRLKLPPKNKKGPDDQTVTLCDLIGYSPDELDAVTLAVHRLLHPQRKMKAGAI